MSAPVECFAPSPSGRRKAEKERESTVIFQSPESDFIGTWDEYDSIDDIGRDEVLRVFDERGNRGLTTREISQELDYPFERVRGTLNTLREEGVVDRIREGRSIFWFRPNPENPLLNGFGILSETDIPQAIREEREKGREDWEEHEDLSR